MTISRALGHLGAIAAILLAFGTAGARAQTCSADPWNFTIGTGSCQLLRGGLLGQPNGVAALDSGGHLISSEITSSLLTTVLGSAPALNLSSPTASYQIGGAPVIGYAAMTEGGYDPLIGYNTGLNISAGAYAGTFVGYYAGGSGGNAATGVPGGTGLTGAEDTCIGFVACTQMTTGTFATALGVNALGHETTGSSDTAVGEDAMRNTVGVNENTAVGANALRNGIAGANYNTAIGFGALSGTDGGNEQESNNVAVGLNAMEGAAALSTATSNVAVGNGAFEAVTTGSANTFVGFQAGVAATTAANNVAIGYNSGVALTTQYEETFLGTGSGANATGPQNTFLGYQSGAGVTSGVGNVLIGDSEFSGSANQVTTGSGNISIGYNSAVPSPTASSQMSLGNAIYATGLTGVQSTVSPARVGIGTTAPNAALTVGSAGGGADDGHIGVLGQAPTLSGCGTSPSISATASDVHGTITEGATATGCTITFAAAFQTAPDCVLSSPSGSAITGYSATTTALTITNASASGNKYSYVCLQ